MLVSKLPFKSLLLYFMVPLSGICTSLPTAAQDIVGMTLMPVNGMPKIGVIVDNPTSIPVWVEVRIGSIEPLRCGSGKNQLLAGERMMILCPATEIVAKKDYPVTAVFDADNDATMHIVTKTRQGRFNKKDVNWLNSQLEHKP